MAIKKIFNRLFQRENLVFFSEPQNGIPLGSKRIPEGYTIKKYDTLKAIPNEVASLVFKKPFDVMKYRMMRNLAILLVITSETGEIAAYGWIQDWQPFKRRFKKISGKGWMLGFYWTAPKFRGKGLYQALLQESVATLSRRTRKIFIYASKDNVASLRGIEKAGFVFVANLKVLRILKVINFSKKIYAR